LLGKLDHIGHVVKNFDEAMYLYTKKFGLKPRRIIDGKGSGFGSRAAFFPFAGIELELIQPGGKGEDPAARCLKERGEGVCHISLRVDDIDAEMKEWQKKGFTVTEFSKPENRTRIAFLEPEETKGLWIELIKNPD
jgi:4-hydroxyphenylpyruvate dioxygenase-like putative hemolysin